ncbi:hypothetical protein MMC14_002783 [Varicellaria rhodocarpa]|nr:hypothetical protein [Varicellaria rhodocarpa]
MPEIKISNKSGHDQEFEVHGWNHEKNITVKPHSTSVINAGDNSSGAVIALHEGHEGEQAEITFDIQKGNEVYDTSVIVGAGGNLTIEQDGDPRTLKGDPHFMQQLQEAWKKASPATRESLKNCVHLNKEGVPIRIDAPKNYPDLEKFVRTFANGQTYIGIGAWGNSKGDPNDNKLSSATPGVKNVLITYNDGDASPAKPPPHLVHRMVEKAVQQNHGDKDDNGPGIILSNKSGREESYFFYDNYWNGNGTAGANFDHPLKSVRLRPHTSAFVNLPDTFKGRVQRGTTLPATWAEFQLDASNDHKAHGDISLEQGCDGAATISSTDGTHHVGGFTEDILKNAPEAALVKKPDGSEALATTVGNWMSGPNQEAIDYERKIVGQRKAYITGGTGTDDIASSNRRLAVDFY